MTKLRLSLLFFILLGLTLPAQLVLADTGPKPSMEFTFKQNLPGGQVTITSGILYECEQADCSDASSLQELGPQRFTCDTLSCSATAYGFATYHRLEIQFSDGKTRQSNIFETAGFNSKYTVTINSDDLLVEAQLSLTAAPPTVLIVVACICALVIGLVIIGLIIFLVQRSRKK